MSFNISFIRKKKKREIEQKSVINVLVAVKYKPSEIYRRMSDAYISMYASDILL